MGSRLKGRFDVVLYSPAEELERQAWADRVLRTLERLAVLTGNRPFTGFRGEQQVTVDLTRSAIEAQIEANVNREGGQVFTELGSIFGVGITSPHGDAEVDDVIASFRVGNTEPRFHNGVTVVFLGLRRIRRERGCAAGRGHDGRRSVCSGTRTSAQIVCAVWTSLPSNEIRRSPSAATPTAASR